MVAAAEITGEREIIFPEITAIAMGALAAPKQVWNTSKLRLFRGGGALGRHGRCDSTSAAAALFGCKRRLGYSARRGI